MNVTSATPEAIGRTARELREWTQGSRERVRHFLRHPISEYRRYVEEFGYDYPVALVTLVDLVLLTTGAGAVAQRYAAGYFPSLVPLAALLIIALIGPPCVIFNVPPHPVFMAGLVVFAEALFLIQPVSTDMAPGLLVIGAGEIAATASTAISLPCTAIMGAELAFFAIRGHVDGLVWYSLAMVMGWMTGRMLNYQRRYLYQERENQDVRARAAAEEERRRIAREVHDVIAHSLSVTLLHVTAARHALQTDRDVDEAIDALSDAERLGRQAMADIRRTVGLLGRRSSLIPEPGLADIADLVEDFVRAGLTIDYRLEGDASTVSAGLGLTLYRICQESLSNIAKHAPGERAVLRIVLHAKYIDVTATNTLPGNASPRIGRGMGIAGMHQRIAPVNGSLTAGPEGDGWRVHARIPLNGQFLCPAAPAEEHLRTILQTMIAKPAREGM
ncbi:histidine kinase [Nocardia sp. CDC153]|uniref:sensor histidine kinase n=1 Tax=Nocardia sp. CDC153 TaxID=3112167 RepID=UPI002DC02475|nr:histidine kinase [Nocardia sp. CDC153]MEC3954593.1 histidine kinase [Nocardia sp. CDC153]